MPAQRKKAVEEDKYAPSSWGQKTDVFDGTAEDVRVPSGQLCRVRRPGVKGLVAAGVLDHVDQLSKIVGEKHITRAKGGRVEKVDAESLAKQPEKVAEIIDVVDKVVCHIVVKPQIHRSPKCSVCGKDVDWHSYVPVEDYHDPVVKLDAGKIYAFQVDMDDRMFLLNFAVGGTRDLESFRQQREELLVGVESGSDVSVSPE